MAIGSFRNSELERDVSGSTLSGVICAYDGSITPLRTCNWSLDTASGVLVER